jgi:hypothetical protein
MKAIPSEQSCVSSAPSTSTLVTSAKQFLKQCDPRSRLQIVPRKKRWSVTSFNIPLIAETQLDIASVLTTKQLRKLMKARHAAN